MFENFQDYAKALKPSLEAAFTGHLTRLLGETLPLQSFGGAKLLAGGKKIRGSLLCLVVDTLGGALEEALPRAVAIELIQTATLIHDDFVDQHRFRRNSAAIWTLEGGRRAVLLGDIIFSSAIQMMCEMGGKDCLIVSNAIAEVSRGAYQEPLDPSSLLKLIETDQVDAAIYLKIVHLKTGVLFGAACQLGALAAGADDKLQQVWRNYGMKIGTAYQISDDLYELEKCLVTRSITATDIADFTPALLFFARESRSGIIKALRREPSELNGELLRHFQTAVELMKTEKQRYLQSALDGIGKDSPDNENYRLVLSAPWDLIRMFDETNPLVSSP